MTKERYDELKKQGGTIWHWEYGEIKLEDTDICEESDLSGNHTGWALVYFGTGYDIFLELKDLEEDATKGKWKHKTTSERIERFEPPMWCDAGNYVFRFVINNCFYEFYSGNIIFLKDMCGVVHFKFGQTKENYIKACEIVRDLFRGNNG